jgi:hypothetical protein
MVEIYIGQYQIIEGRDSHEREWQSGRDRLREKKGEIEADKRKNKTDSNRSETKQRDIDRQNQIRDR